MGIASVDGYKGDIAEDYPREWNKILRVTGLHPDSKKPGPLDDFKENTFTPLMNVVAPSDALVGSFGVVESAIDNEYLPLRVQPFDDDKQIVISLLPGSEHKIGFSDKSIRGYKA